MLPDEGTCSIETGNCFEHITDEAICCESLDLLGRKSFSRNLAEIIRGWKGTNGSLVLGVEGSWGSGKSSIKNMALNVLQPDKKLADSLPLDMYPWNQMAHLFESEVNVMEFNPWRFSSQDELVTKFLNELGAIVRANASLKVEDLSTLLDIYGSLMSLSGDNSQQGVINFIKQLLPKSRRSLEGLKKDIAAATKKWPKKLVVVIDDIDRLEPAEVRAVMKLVKSQVDLPNIIYLLLYDREHVAKAYEEHHGDGEEYLGKIVNYSVRVPVAQEAAIFRMLSFWLNIIFKDYFIVNERRNYLHKQDAHYEMINSSELFSTGIGGYFNNLRDVKRFLGSFACILNNFVEGEFIKVEPLELVCIESIRFFEPNFYEYIFFDKDYFIDKIWDGNGVGNFEFEKVSNAKATNKVLRFLFGYSSVDYNHKNTIRISRREYFEKYFSFVDNDDYLSEGEFNRIIEVFNSECVSIDNFESLKFKKDAWERLYFEICKGDGFTIPLPFVFSKFFKCGFDYSDGLYDCSIDMIRIVVAILDRDKESLSENLLGAIRESEDVSILHWLLGRSIHGGNGSRFEFFKEIRNVDRACIDEYASRIESLCVSDPYRMIEHFASRYMLSDLKTIVDDKRFKQASHALFKAFPVEFVKFVVLIYDVDGSYDFKNCATDLSRYLEFGVFDLECDDILNSKDVNVEDRKLFCCLRDAWRDSLTCGPDSRNVFKEVVEAGMAAQKALAPYNKRAAQVRGVISALNSNLAANMNAASSLLTKKP